MRLSDHFPGVPRHDHLQCSWVAPLGSPLWEQEVGELGAKEVPVPQQLGGGRGVVRVVRDGGHGAMEADSRRLDAEEREPILSGRYLAK